MRLAHHALIALALAVPAVAWAQLRGSERVEFPVVGMGGQEQIFGHLFLPAVAGGAPVPAVVIVHGSGGVGEGREGFWGRELAASGVAALAIDLADPRRGIEILGRSCMRRGATIGFSPSARERAVEDVKTFLKTHVMK